MTHGTILLVDDEAKIREALASALRDEGHEVVETASGTDARALLGQRLFDVLVVDNLMPDLTGLDLIRELVTTVPESERPQILMMTAHATVESAIEAMKLGALDYLQKPFEVDELLVVVGHALDHQRLRVQHRYLISEREVYDFMTRAVRRAPRADAVFAPCPQWHAFELARFLELDTGLPFVTGDGCDFWYAFKTLGIRGVKSGYGILLDQLSTTDKPDGV